MTDTNVWRYQDALSRDIDAGDLSGYDVEAVDGDIGKVDKASTEASRRYIVVDTGFWIFGKKRLVPAGVVKRVDHTARKVHVSMTKDQIKSAPDLDEHRPAYRDEDYEEYGRYYGRYGWK